MYIYIYIENYTRESQRKATRVDDGETIETGRARLGSDKGGSGGGGMIRGLGRRSGHLRAVLIEINEVGTVALRVGRRVGRLVGCEVHES